MKILSPVDRVAKILAEGEHGLVWAWEGKKSKNIYRKWARKCIRAYRSAAAAVEKRRRQTIGRRTLKSMKDLMRDT